MDMQGKVAVVTGGGTGLGREVSRLFAERGAGVAIVYSRSQEDAEKCAREIARDGQRVTTHRLDVADEAAAGPVFDEIAGQHGDKITFLKMNVDENPVTPSSYRVTGIPTINLYKDGEVVKSIVGARPKAALLNELSAFIA
jgi:NAD(P)-dependent dehydrogenase (short-subunit alcohol dehydrogenase family)